MASLLNMSGGSLLKKGLPYDAEIEYLESTGAQYIDTGVIGTSGFKRLECTIVAQFTNTGGRQLTGASNAFYFGVNRGSWEASYDRYVSGADFNKHTFKKVLDQTLIKHRFYVDGVLKDDYTVSVTDSHFKYNFYLFALDGNGPILYSSYKLYSAKIYVNGELKFDGFPVVKNNIGYMYDKVTGQLFGNSGTGSFILGNDI